MKKFFTFLTVVALASAIVATVLADTIIRPPTVEWTPVTKYSDGRDIAPERVVKYNVYRSVTTATNWTLVATTTNLSYADTNVVLGTVYHYRIAAELFGLEAAPSSTLVFMSYAPAPLTLAPSMKQ